MSTDPTTTSQVQAYRFVLRRMESALVRKDAVMLHEPMRQHLRATAAGLILALLGLIAFFIIGKINSTNEAAHPHSAGSTGWILADNPVEPAGCGHVGSIPGRAGWAGC